MKMIFKYLIATAIPLLMSIGELSAQEQRLRLFYDKPASEWNEALPIGNSRLGVMVYGDPSKEQLQLNEETIWAGGPGNNVPKNTHEIILKIRELLAEGKAAEAQKLSNETFP